LLLNYWYSSFSLTLSVYFRIDILAGIKFLIPLIVWVLFYLYGFLSLFLLIAFYLTIYPSFRYHSLFFFLFYILSYLLIQCCNCFGIYNIMYILSSYHFCCPIFIALKFLILFFFLILHLTIAQLHHIFSFLFKRYGSTSSSCFLLSIIIFIHFPIYFSNFLTLHAGEVQVLFHLRFSISPICFPSHISSVTTHCVFRS
jgi:hypothetical protein